MKKRIIAQIIVFILIIAAFGGGGYLLSQNGKDAATINNEKKDCLLMADQYNVSFQSVGGRVMEVYIAEGQTVNQGETLMILDTTDIDLQIRQVAGETAVLDKQITAAQAAIQEYDRNVLQYGVETAQLAVQTAQDNYARQKELYANQAIAQTTFTDAETRLKNAKLALAQSQESLQKAESSIAKAKLDITVLQEQKANLALKTENLANQKNRMTLKAPQGGEVLNVIAKAGENINANAPVAVIRSGGIYFDLYIPETKVSQFKEGSSVQVYVVALDKTRTGKIRLVQSAPQYTNTRMTRDNAQGDLSSFQVRIYLEEQESEELLPGMTVEVLLDATTI